MNIHIKRIFGLFSVSYLILERKVASVDLLVLNKYIIVFISRFTSLLCFLLTSFTLHLGTTLLFFYLPLHCSHSPSFGLLAGTLIHLKRIAVYVNICMHMCIYI